MKVTFYKCNGNNNTFVILLYNDLLIDKIKGINVPKLCKTIDKNMDGLITANIETNNIVMDYYNNDGSWETFCLNGLRCLSLALNHKMNESNFNIICNNVNYSTVVLNNSTIEVKLYEPNYRMKLNS